MILDKKPMKIREMKEKEIKEVIYIIKEVFPHREIKYEDILNSKIKIAKIKNKTVGFVKINRIKGKVVVNGLGVLKEVRNMGIGTRLLRAVIREYPKERVYLKVSIFNFPAIRIYSKLGFFPLKIKENKIIMLFLHNN